MTPPPPPFGCACKRTEELCEQCRDESYATLRGVAAARGIFWCESLMRVMSLSREWPSTPTARMLAIAERRVADLARDVQLRAMLAAEFLAAAEHTWDRALALLDRPDQPLRTAQLVLDVVLARGARAHRVLVEAADLELRQAVVTFAAS
jgi:hypothetical protein